MRSVSCQFLVHAFNFDYCRRTASAYMPLPPLPVNCMFVQARVGVLLLALLFFNNVFFAVQIFSPFARFFFRYMLSGTDAASPTLLTCVCLVARLYYCHRRCYVHSLFHFGTRLLYVSRASVQSLCGIFGHFPGANAVLLARVVWRPCCGEYAGESLVGFVVKQSSMLQIPLYVL